MDDFFAIWEQALTSAGMTEYADEKYSVPFKVLLDLLLAANTRMNLTAIRDMNGVITKHFIDSLTAAHYIPEGARVIDVGCGAGFPTLPLAIIRPDLCITALDSTAKKLGFVSQTAAALHLGNVSVLNARAEESGLRECFDVCCARAVAALDILCELCLPLVAVGGSFIAMKSRTASDELAAAANAVRRLGGEPAQTHEVRIADPDGELERTIIVINKSAPTPREFPRRWAQITKKPL